MDEITQFRQANGPALYDSSHEQHAAAVEQLSQLYQAKFPADGAPNADDKLTPASEDQPASLLDAAPQPKGIDPDDIEAMTSPATSPDNFRFKGVADAPAVVSVEGEDGVQEIAVERSEEFEQDARGFLHDLGATPAQGAAFEAFYVDVLRSGISERKASQMYDDSRSTLIREHGEKWQDVLAAANKVFLAAPERVRDMLNATGLSNHQMVVDACVAAARKKGYL